MSAEDVSYVTSHLTRLLSRHGQVRGSKRRMSYTSLPMLTEAKFDRVELRKLMAPPIPDDGLLTEQLVDAFLYPLIDGQGSPQQALLHAGGDRLHKYVTVADTIEEQTVRLLFACSTADSATFTCDESSFLIQHDQRTFGIDGGRIVSRFCSDLRLNVNPKAVLTRTQQVVVGDSSFCSLYREAMRRGRNMPAALIALRTGYPGVKFKRMADVSDAMRYPPPAKFRQWEDVLNNNADPVAKLYSLLVPRWMNGTNFQKIFGNLATRPISPKPMTVTRMINRLHLFFNQIGTDVL